MREKKTESFIHHPIHQLIDTIIGQGAASIEWNVLRYRRLLEPDGSKSPYLSTSIDFVAAELDSLAKADEWETLNALPANVRWGWLSAAREHAGTLPRMLAMLAELMRTAGTGPAPDYDEVPLSDWEAEERYPHLYQITGLMTDAGYGLEEAVHAAIRYAHPSRCEFQVPSTTRQAMEVVAVCHRSRNLRKQITGLLYLGPRELTLIAEMTFGHMKEHHSRESWAE